MKHRKMFMKGIWAAALASLLVFACDNGVQETQYTKIDAPKVALEPVGEYGFELSWEHGVEVAQYIIYRAQGNWPRKRLAALELSDTDRFGKHTYQDIVQFNEENDPSLLSNTKYEYTVLAIPVRSHLRDSNEWSGEITSATIVPIGTPAPQAGISVTIDGEKRSVTATATKPSGADDLPVDVQYNVQLWRINPENDVPYIKEETGFGSELEVSVNPEWEDPAAREAEGEWFAIVETRFGDGSAGWDYFTETSVKSASATYAYLFDRRYNNIGSLIATAPGVQRPVLADPPGIPNDVPGTGYIAGTGTLVENFTALVDFSGIRGLPGVTYIVERREQTKGDTGYGTWSDYEAVDLYSYTSGTPAYLSLVTGSNYGEFEDPIKTDIFGVFKPQNSKLWDINLEADPAKVDKQYQYRIHAGSGATADWVEGNVITVKYNNNMDYFRLKINAGGRTPATLPTATAGLTPPAMRDEDIEFSMTYTVRPTFANNVQFPDMWGQDLFDDVRIDLYWALFANTGATGDRYGWNEDQKVSFTKETALPFALAKSNGSTEPAGLTFTVSATQLELEQMRVTTPTPAIPGGLYVRYFLYIDGKLQGDGTADEDPLIDFIDDINVDSAGDPEDGHPYDNQSESSTIIGSLLDGIKSADYMGQNEYKLPFVEFLDQF